VAERAGLDAQSLFWFRIGALLHDVGKLSIPAEVLNKPGKLTDEEWQLIRGHPAAGVEMLRDVEFPWDITPIVRSHHERWDGRGYPDGLRGESIPLVARILCVADVYDALTSVRSYKRRLSHDETLELLRKDSGTAFDPQVFAWFEDVAPAWAARAVAHPSEPPEEEIEREAAATRLALGLDALTGLQPRVPFAAACAHVLAARATDGRPVSVIRLALRLHDAVAVPGDALLRMAAEVISRNTSGGALVGRWSTADFTVLLPDVAGPDALAVGARLAEAVALQRGAGSMGTEVAGALRTAWAVASAPVDGTTPEALLEVLETRTEDALRADDRGTPVGARPSHG
jgi:putative nucleotidyltransferase with HDIG domain